MAELKRFGKMRMCLNSARALNGVYRPSIFDKLLAAVFAVWAVVFLSAMAHISSDGFDDLEKVFSCVIVLVAIVMAEVHLRTVTIDDEFLAQRSPFGLYRQKLRHDDLSGIRVTRMARGDVLEVCHLGRWIVFCSNRTFRRRTIERPNQ
jgi:hypothetical protein